MNAFIFLLLPLGYSNESDKHVTSASFSEKHPVDRNINLISSVEVLSTVFGMWNLDFFSHAVQALLPSPELIDNSGNVP